MNLHLKKMHFNFKFNFADMEVVLQSKLIRKHKSDFLFDLILHPTDQIYLRIKQNIIDDNKKYELKINPMVLNDLIGILQSFQKDYNVFQKKAPDLIFSKSKENEIVHRYLNKGLSIDDLSTQFDCQSKVIEQVLLSHEIPIVDNRLPKKKKNFF